MWEFFWFILGAVLYQTLQIILNVGKKAQFILSLKLVVFRLLAHAYQQLLTANTLKHDAYCQKYPDDKEKVKALENADALLMEKWKREAINGLEATVPPPYKNLLGVEQWDDLVIQIDTYYKDEFNRITKNERQN